MAEIAPREHVALVGCVKLKARGEHAAQDLYTSPLFVGRRSSVERAGLRWWILSAEHGLVAPDTRLRAYDRTLNAMKATERRAWGDQVDVLGPLDRYVFEIHAGNRYVEAIGPGLARAGARYVVPTAGKGLGQQLAFYASHRAEGTR